MAYLNGRFPTSATKALLTAPGQRLEPIAARQWDALAQSVKNTYGWLPVLTDSYRPYSTQERIFRDRYRQGNRRGQAGFTNDVRYWGGQPWTRRSGTAAAAVPGTSNHGLGKAVDVTALGGFNGARYKQLAAIAGRFGYSNANGRKINEPWHWEFTGAYTGTRPIGGTSEQKDWLDMVSEAELRKILRQEMWGYRNDLVNPGQDAYSILTKIGNNMQVNRGGRVISLAQEVADVKTHNMALEEAIRALAATAGQDSEKILAEVEQRVAKALRENTVSVDVKVSDGSAQSEDVA